jgi:drug/metabolite transporter (DMT)-like permease
MDNRIRFAALCVFWGGMWLAVKMGVMQTPPMLVACVRAVASGAVLVAIAGAGPTLDLVRRAPGRVVAIAFLSITFSWTAVYWGTVRLSTGVSAIANSGTMPIGLLLFGVMLREDRATRRQVIGIALGIFGLVLLFMRRSGEQIDAAAMIGLAVAVVGALAFCLGSVLARPLLRVATPSAVAASQLLVGGLMSIPAVALIEAPTPAELASLLAPAALLGMAWMVFAGGVAATFIYMRLVRDWGPSRTGMYAFVTPIIATVLGAIVLGERLGPMEVVGAAFMMAGAALVITAPRGKAVEPAV